MTDERQSQTLVGIAGSHGVAVARAVVIAPNAVRYRRRRVSSSVLDDEVERFEQAVLAVQEDLRAKVTALGSGSPHASILEAYELMVDDPTLAKSVVQQIRGERRCADWAVVAATDRIASQLKEVADPYIRERRHDIEFVGELLLRVLAGDEDSLALTLGEPSIIVAHDLSPADTAAMMNAPVVGLVTEVGSRTSHTSIMARALEIPAVVGVRNALKVIAGGETLAVDGLLGTVIVEPGAGQIAEAERRSASYQSMTQQLGRKRHDPAVTRDGQPITLLANIELPQEASMAVEHGALGVGLYRTEFLYVNRSVPPSEEEQLAIFRSVIRDMQGRPITLRTFDIGGDKFTSSFRLPLELNPMLGLRAVRLALVEPQLFLTQLRAMLRASADGDVRIMLPLVTTIGELQSVHVLIEQAKTQLRERGQAYRQDVPIGVMVEVPAAAVMADHFAARAAFLSIGSNDLMQYALAVDRTSEALAQLASPFDPALLRLIVGVIEAAAVHDVPVSLCGEMASEPLGALLLIGLGLRQLSMESMAIPEVKEAIVRVGLDELQRVAATALKCPTAAEVEQLMQDAFGARVQDLISGQVDSGPRSSQRAGRAHS